MTQIEPEENRVDWESALVQRARAGDVRAFERLYRDHVARVYGLCLRMTRDPAMAEDCTQETFINAWKALGSFQTRSSLATWLHRIAVNVALAKRRKASVVLESPASDEDEAIESDWTLETPLEVNEIEAAIGREQLKKLKGFLTARYDLVAHLSQKLGGYDGLILPVTRPGCGHSYYRVHFRLDPARQRERRPSAATTRSASTSPAVVATRAAALPPGATDVTSVAMDSTPAGTRAAGLRVHSGRSSHNGLDEGRDRSLAPQEEHPISEMVVATRRQGHSAQRWEARRARARQRA